MMSIEPEEFEAGENVTDQVRRNKPSGIVISVRLTPEDSIKLVDLAEESGKTVSQVARQAIRSFIAQSARPPTFVPEITGGTKDFKVVAFAPLGPRTVVKEEVEVTDQKLPLTPRTVCLSEAA